MSKKLVIIGASGHDMIIYASKRLLQRTPFITYRRWGTDIFVFVLLAYIGRKVVGNTVSNYFTLLLYAVPVFVTVMAVFVIINSLCDIKAQRVKPWTI